jgi:palmitoyl-protein thioesterase
MAEYLQYNSFLPDINNERPEKNEQYAKNMAALSNFVLFKFKEDVTGMAIFGQLCLCAPVLV